MSDKIVYVHPDHEAEGVTIITPQDLDALVDNDWAVKEHHRKKIDGKMVDMYHLYKPSKERGLSVAQPRRDGGMLETSHSGGNDTRGMMIAPSNNSFLGTSDFNGLPGMQVANSLQIQNAYARGVDAANRGHGKETNPYGAGTIGGTQWLKGYNAGSRGIPSSSIGGSTHDAYELGKAAGSVNDPDLEVHCPYPAGTAHRNEWVRGFKEAGGRVE